MNQILFIPPYAGMCIHSRKEEFEPFFFSYTAAGPNGLCMNAVNTQSAAGPPACDEMS